LGGWRAAELLTSVELEAVIDRHSRR